MCTSFSARLVSLLISICLLFALSRLTRASFFFFSLALSLCNYYPALGALLLPCLYVALTCDCCLLVQGKGKPVCARKKKKERFVFVLTHFAEYEMVGKRTEKEKPAKKEKEPKESKGKSAPKKAKEGGKEKKSVADVEALIKSKGGVEKVSADDLKVLLRHANENLKEGETKHKLGGSKDDLVERVKALGKY